eukprot:SM000041S15486  [mRNA]  locus=s41:344872:351336:- [translate_table: standard]
MEATAAAARGRGPQARESGAAARLAACRQPRRYCRQLGRSPGPSADRWGPAGARPRRRLAVVSASPPTEDVAVAAAPLTIDDMVGYLKSGCKPKDKWSFQKYAEYALDVPMYFVYRDKRYIDASGLSFRDFMEGKLAVLPGARPTIQDWENHLTTIFPEVRLKRYLEMRGADGGPWRRLCALPALWVGLLYDEQSLQGAVELIADWTDRERAMLRRKVPAMGLKTPFRDGLLRHVAQDIYKLAKEGLERRGYKEASFLHEVGSIVQTGDTPAEKLLQAYHGRWGESVDLAYKELIY